MKKVLHYQIIFEKPFNLNQKALVSFISSTLLKFHGTSIFDKIQLRVDNNNIYIKTDKQYENKIDGVLFLVFNYENKVCKISRFKK